jgi:ubiquinone/menaquinone biosynthesis C-methylase UbiE
VEIDEYRRMAEVETSHWWYQATNQHLQVLLAPYLPTGGQLLDIGCGTGAVGRFLADHGTLVGADFEYLALELYQEAHPEVMLASADAQALPFADNSFDVSLCVTVLCHESIPDPQVVVDELARVTKPGGVVCLWEPGVKSLRRAHDRVTHSARRFSLADLRQHATDAKLEVVEATGAHSYLIPAAALKSLVERGTTSSDLAKHQGGLGGVLRRLADTERKLLRSGRRLPYGLSVCVVARKPAANA